MKDTMGQQEWLNIFGDNLASILEEERMSQRELARLTGLSESTISKYINNLCVMWACCHSGSTS